MYHRDPSFYLDISSVAPAMKLGVNGGLLQSSFALDGPVWSDLLKFSPVAATLIRLSRPSLNAPPGGENFVKSMCRLVSIDANFAMTAAVWTVRRHLGLCVERVSGLGNVPQPSGPTPANAPVRYRRFERFLELLDKRVNTPLIIRQSSSDTREMSVEFRFSPEIEINGLLGRDSRLGFFKVTGLVKDEEIPGNVYIRSRSLTRILFHLSHSVDFPQTFCSISGKTKTNRTMLLPSYLTRIAGITWRTPISNRSPPSSS